MKATEGTYTNINAGSFEVEEKMTMSFKGKSCLINDAQGNTVGKYLDTADCDVEAGYICYVLYCTSITFTKCS